MLGVDAERDNAPETHVILVAVCRHQSIRQRSLPDACVNRSHMSERNTPGTGQGPLVPGRDEMLGMHSQASLTIPELPPHHSQKARTRCRANCATGETPLDLSLTSEKQPGQSLLRTNRCNTEEAAPQTPGQLIRSHSE